MEGLGCSARGGVQVTALMQNATLRCPTPAATAEQGRTASATLTTVKFDTTTVRLILAIADEGSISRAADKLSLAVAAASRRVSDLEAQLGIKLFQRVPHGVEITESGTKLVEYIRQIDNLIDRLKAMLGRSMQGSTGALSSGRLRRSSSSFLLVRFRRSSANSRASR